MFTNLHELELGDHFYINILGEVHAYEVDRIQTVLPDDTSHFEKEPDKDYITLVTCTPLGVNSHRLLVRGHRVQYNLDKFDNRDNDINLNKNNLKIFYTKNIPNNIYNNFYIIYHFNYCKKKNYQLNLKK